MWWGDDKRQTTSVVWALVVAVIFWMSGCVAAGETDECSAQDAGGSGGGGGGYPPKTKQWEGPSSETLQTFSAARSANDAVPRDDCEVQDMLTFLSEPPTFNPPGSALLSESRLALDDLSLDRKLFLIPTDTGGLCTIVTGIGGHWECGDLNNPTWSWWDPGSGPAFAYGNLENGVVDVQCTVSEGRIEADVQNNAFYCELPEEARSEQPGLIIKYFSGNERRIESNHVS